MITGWELDNQDYVITNNGKVAAKVTNTTSTLFSQGPQFDANHIIEFKVILCNMILFTLFVYTLIYLYHTVFRNFTRRNR